MKNSRNWTLKSVIYVSVCKHITLWKILSCHLKNRLDFAILVLKNSFICHENAVLSFDTFLFTFCLTRQIHFFFCLNFLICFFFFHRKTNRFISCGSQEAQGSRSQEGSQRLGRNLRWLSGKDRLYSQNRRIETKTLQGNCQGGIVEQFFAYTQFGYFLKCFLMFVHRRYDTQPRK